MRGMAVTMGEAEAAIAGLILLGIAVGLWVTLRQPPWPGPGDDDDAKP